MDASNMDDKKSSVSFVFKRKQDAVQLEKSLVNEDVDKEDKETDYVLSLEGKEVKSTKNHDKPSKQEFVIPLITHNKWRQNEDKAHGLINNLSENKSTPSSITSESLDDQAAKEILQDTAKYNQEWDDRGKEDPNVAIPLLMQNKIPDGFESDDKLDVALRPSEPSDADYEQIPIEHFGLAMLRGMGWNKDKGIGKNSKVVDPIEAHIRPKGLGLGADRNNSGPDRKSTQNGAVDDNGEELEMKKNAYCIVTSGTNKDLYGTIEGIDEDNSRIMVKLSLSCKVVNIMQSNVRIVNKKEFEKYSKYLNKQKVDEYKANEEKRMEENGQHIKLKSHKHSEKRSKLSDSDSDDHKHKKHKQVEKHSRNHLDSKHKNKHSKRDGKNDRDSKHNAKFDSNGSNSKSSSRETPVVSWLQNDLRVRVIDKDLSKGKYYKEKVIIIDVPTRGMCVCKTDDGKVIDSVQQSSLETIVPRTENAFVAIVSGAHRGQIGQIMKRDKDQCLALVQLLTDRDIVLKLQYDDICEFTGDIHNHDDY